MTTEKLYQNTFSPEQLELMDKFRSENLMTGKFVPHNNHISCFIDTGCSITSASRHHRTNLNMNSMG
jgi:hypothetical protein